jgi:hypothetical protein
MPNRNWLHLYRTGGYDMNRRRRPDFTYHGKIIRNIRAQDGQFHPIDAFNLTKGYYHKRLFLPNDRYHYVVSLTGSAYRAAQATLKTIKKASCEIDEFICRNKTPRWTHTVTPENNICSDCGEVIFNRSIFIIDENEDAI